MIHVRFYLGDKLLLDKENKDEVIKIPKINEMIYVKNVKYRVLSLVEDINEDGEEILIINLKPPHKLKSYE